MDKNSFKDSISDPYLIITSITGVLPSSNDVDICRYIIEPSGKKLHQTAINSEELCNFSYLAILECEKEDSGIPYDGMVQPKINVEYPCPDWLAIQAKWPKIKGPDIGLLLLGIILIIGTGIIIIGGFIHMLSWNIDFYTTFLSDINSKCLFVITLILFITGAIFINTFFKQVKRYKELMMLIKPS